MHQCLFINVNFDQLDYNIINYTKKIQINVRPITITDLCRERLELKKKKKLIIIPTVKCETLYIAKKNLFNIAFLLFSQGSHLKMRRVRKLFDNTVC
jgi:hypothetical protein